MDIVLNRFIDYFGNRENCPYFKATRGKVHDSESDTTTYNSVRDSFGYVPTFFNNHILVILPSFKA